MGILATTNYTAIVRPLQWLVVIVVWLFFLRVVRAVWVEVRPAGPRQQARADRKAERQQNRSRRRQRRRLRLEVVEPTDYRGTVYDLENDVTLGRNPSCGISTSYDAYSSSTHARLYRDADKLWVEDLGSTNGTFVNSEQISRPVRLSRGDLLQVGATVFEVVK
jgi:pSer/pThr/pTyr-binding forkhead associated (FHA) protein